ncbi:hypothetical protein C8R47DRAFT_1196118 [Mycena vitilis]|nr:hypothetical protein C8R47DRAFT_1204503 [Mycena vitilis]KAJ6489270.1 hypothetical protein C8R47DRAFT_1196118 [Mycena vitilis]
MDPHAQITALVSALATDMGIPFTKLADGWYKSVRGKFSGPRHWNTYQAYIRHEAYGRRECARLRPQDEVVPSVEQLHSGDIGICYQRFKKEEKDWKDILDNFEGLSAPKPGREARTFDRAAAQTEALLGRLQRDGITGVVALASNSRTYAYETSSAVGFFSKICRANTELICVHLQAYRTHQLSLKAVEIAFHDPHTAPPPRPQKIYAHADPQPAHETVQTLTDLLRTAFLKDIPGGQLPGNGFPWLTLVVTLANNGLYLDGYPNGTPLAGYNPCAPQSSKSCVLPWAVARRV